MLFVPTRSIQLAGCCASGSSQSLGVGMNPQSSITCCSASSLVGTPRCLCVAHRADLG